MLNLIKYSIYYHKIWKKITMFNFFDFKNVAWKKFVSNILMNKKCVLKTILKKLTNKKTKPYITINQRTIQNHFWFIYIIYINNNYLSNILAKLSLNTIIFISIIFIYIINFIRTVYTFYIVNPLVTQYQKSINNNLIQFFFFGKIQMDLRMNYWALGNYLCNISFIGTSIVIK